MSNKYKHIFIVIIIGLILLVIIYAVYERKIETMEQIIKKGSS